MLFGSRAGFGLEFHIEQDPDLLCVDIFVGGLRVNTWDNAFYPPLLVKKLKDEAARFRTPTAAPAEFTSPSESFRIAEGWMYEDDGGSGTDPSVAEALARCEFLEWGECTDQVTALAFPDGERLHLVCRVRDADGPARGAGARQEPVVASVSRAVFVETLEGALAVAEREWSTRLAALLDRGRADDGGTAPGAGSR
ncbi:hypothetical protein [Kitasatospora sp. NPDC057500]|uniref:hypothetical protein n=1 Tax=Kitasatospora sp. NPDC057500 TaxID=3346151 RepID=UPI003692F73A